MKKEKLYGSLTSASKIILIILPVIFALTALCIGRMSISPLEVLKALGSIFGIETDVDPKIIIAVKTMRLPRILLAMLAGAGLSVSGCGFQSLFQNPLATPDTLGVASGASFGAALGILMGFGMAGIQAVSLIFGGTAVLLTYILGGENRGNSTVVLAGIMIGSLFTSLVSLVKFTANSDTQLPAITYWLMGSLSGASYKTLTIGAPLIILGIAMLYLIKWRLNVLTLSPEEARATGTDMRLLRGITVISATAICASCVSMCGQVGWVGLLVPHICRMKFGSNHMSLIPASISIGAVFMLTVDTIARSVSASEIPISVLTAIIGAPFFIYLMKKSGGWSL